MTYIGRAHAARPGAHPAGVEIAGTKGTRGTGENVSTYLLIGRRARVPRTPQIDDRWDACNKALHRECTPWIPFRELSEQALATTYRELRIDADPEDTVADSAGLLASMATWPLWPDVSADSLLGLPPERLGLLTNIDTAVLEMTAVMLLSIFDPPCVMTSETVQAYKQSADFYHRAGASIGHLAAWPHRRGTFEAHFNPGSPAFGWLVPATHVDNLGRGHPLLPAQSASSAPPSNRPSQRCDLRDRVNRAHQHDFSVQVA
ncbi:hypothetical protein [Arthrobacter sp. A5]|uniref:hypothetical protein n=1 Tax=Arthrobacter sp. A5 TaxID=576926 RepID=UPI003DAA4671